MWPLVGDAQYKLQADDNVVDSSHFSASVSSKQKFGIILLFIKLIFGGPGDNSVVSQTIFLSLSALQILKMSLSGHMARGAVGEEGITSLLLIYSLH